MNGGVGMNGGAGMTGVARVAGCGCLRREYLCKEKGLAR